MKFEDTLRHKELDDFLDVKEVKGWKLASKAETVFSFVFLVGLCIVVGLLLLAVYLIK